MMLLRSQNISYFSSLLCAEQWTGNPKAAGSNPARGQFFAMLIYCSRCSDGSMWLPFS